MSLYEYFSPPHPLQFSTSSLAHLIALNRNANKVLRYQHLRKHSRFSIKQYVYSHHLYEQLITTPIYYVYVVDQASHCEEPLIYVAHCPQHTPACVANCLSVCLSRILLLAEVSA